MVQILIKNMQTFKHLQQIQTGSNEIHANHIFMKMLTAWCDHELIIQYYSIQTTDVILMVCSWFTRK